MRAWRIAIFVALTTLMTGIGLGQEYRAVGEVAAEVDGTPLRFHAFEVIVEGQAISTTTWRTITMFGREHFWIDAFLVEPDLLAGEPEDAAFPVFGFSFYVDAASHELAATEFLEPAAGFIPDGTNQLARFEALPGQLVMTVTAFRLDGGRVSVTGTIEGTLGYVEGFGDEPDPERTVTVSGTFDLRDVAKGE
jgi:hypothetical protein